MIILQVFVHFPESKEGKEELIKKVSGIHADFVMDYIRQLKLSKEQITIIIEKIIEKT